MAATGGECFDIVTFCSDLFVETSHSVQRIECHGIYSSSVTNLALVERFYRLSVLKSAANDSTHRTHHFNTVHQKIKLMFETTSSEWKKALHGLWVSRNNNERIESYPALL